MNRLKALGEQGQSVWLDFMRRTLIGPELDRLIEEDGLGGITSNPAIFEKAIGHSPDYDAQFGQLMAAGDLSAGELYERLAILDIQLAADRLRPIYDRTGRRDGFVSLEVSPYLANDTEATVAEARRLWQLVDRPNLMIKVPGTPAGVPAIATLIGDGINVNVTLLFAREAYIAVAEAYLDGLERLAEAGADLGGVASVASFFVSRIDTLIDGLLDKRVAAGAADAAAHEALKGTIAIANAKLAYREFKRLFGSDRWSALEARGAAPQRLLWASTGTKNPAFSDVLYVETLIGPETVNTMPPATMDAFRDHGVAAATIEQDLEGAEAALERLEALGISLAAATDKLVVDGVKLFADSFDALLGAVEAKRQAFLGPQLDAMTTSLPGPLAAAVDQELDLWRAEGRVRRLWARDASLWTGADEMRWLGWLDIVPRLEAGLGPYDALTRFAEGYRHALLLGMGGSSLGPEVLAETFGTLPGHPALHVLDSTDPTQVKAFESKIDLASTLFIVSSKSGGTLEPNILKAYFFERAKAVLGAAEAGRRFVAVTDPGSQMQKVAEADGFGHVFFGDPAIGGRYSVLSAFGLVPAAAMGVELGRFLEETEPMIRSCGADVPPKVNPGVVLGTILGVAGRHGRDKVTVLTGPGLEDFGAWVEQLIAESTGKLGKGLIPVDGEPVAAPGHYGADRVFIHLSLAGRPDPAADALAALEQAGHPVVRITLADPYRLGQEFFRFEIATAVAGAILAINPFDQPDVEAAKVAARKLTEAYEASGSLPVETPFWSGDGVALYADERNAGELTAAVGEEGLERLLAAHFARLRPGDYAALLAYIPRDRATIEALQQIRLMVRDAKRVATCVGFGPRFLHSTGQAYKGGPNSGVFLQITCDDPAELPVPGHRYGFGTVKAAQARGDFAVLAERGRRALRVHLGCDLAAGLDRLAASIRRALG